MLKKTVSTLALATLAFTAMAPLAHAQKNYTEGGDLYGGAHSAQKKKTDPTGSAARKGKFDPYSEGARKKSTEANLNPAAGKADPYTDGAKAGKFDPYTDGAKKQ
ncbi:hypothetical protein BKK79_19080 [Cupriavidus sp. USMAA2-4]|uniref:hypothetical protein n=1 Tax=Cupriavidus sp. USMAA2-4 TaxID=876364 RepID=UPI0008A70AF2|nr:hypothetical protein [Cupriavidus sp. USMAA2-4]AOY94277.1 hypothetical protein BKK79_19080 [Cupriavidus sp. USMAA2-4]